MSIADDLESREQTKFKESTAVANQPGVVVVNPDGSNIMSSVTLAVSDIEIGAVELKNATTDDRASIDTSGRLLARVTDTNGATIAVGQATMTASVPVVLASNHSTITVATTSTQVDNAAFTPATSAVTMFGATFDDVATDSVNEGDGGAVRMSANRNLYSTIRDAAGNERGLNVDANGEIGISAIRSALPAGTNAIGKLAANSGVDIGDIDVTSIVPGTGATNLGKAQDAAVGSTDTNIGVMAKRVDTLATITPAAGDYALMQVDSSGRAYVTESNTQTTLFTNFGANATLNIKASAGTLFGFICNNRNVSERFIQFHNTATTPSGGATPLLTFSVPGNSQIGIGQDIFKKEGVNFSTGIAFGFSTTQSTYTAGTASDQFTTVFYS